MPNAAEVWRVNITKTAETDIEEIHRWTGQRFGTAQARIYSRTIADAMAALLAGPEAVGIRPRSDIRPGLYTLHLSRFRRRARHFILFRIGDADRRVIDVLRVLHDAMDVIRHLSPESRQSDGDHR